VKIRNYNYIRFPGHEENIALDGGNTSFEIVDRDPWTVDRKTVGRISGKPRRENREDRRKKREDRRNSQGQGKKTEDRSKTREARQNQ
jgi:hypothetical protein